MVRWAPRRGLRQFDLELAAQCQGDLLQKLERDGGVVGREQEVERGGAGFHAARQLRAGDAAALYLALKLPRDYALERAGLRTPPAVRRAGGSRRNRNRGAVCSSGHFERSIRYSPRQ